MMNDNINDGMDAETRQKLKDNYKEVPASSINIPKEVDSMPNTDFFNTSHDFWRTHDGGSYFRWYDSGVLNGTFNDRRPTYKSIMDTFSETLKNTIRLECEKDDKTSEELIDFFKLLDHSIEMLNCSFEKHLTHRPDGVALMAHLHGVFNSFVEQNIKKGK